MAEAIRRAAPSDAPELEEVGDVYDAIARAAGCPVPHGSLPAVGSPAAEEPLRTIAVPLRAAADDPEGFRNTVRAIDPRIRLVLLAPRGAVDAATSAGFDDVVYFPAASADLAAALEMQPENADMSRRTDGIGRPPPSHPVRQPPQPAPATPVAPVSGPTMAANDSPMRPDRRPPLRSVGGSELAEPPAVERDVVDLVIDDAMHAFASRRARQHHGLSAHARDERSRQRSSTTSEQRRDEVLVEELGDTDLVRAVLEGGDRLRPLALRLIGRELGVEDVRLVSAGEPLREAGEALFDRSVPVRAGDQLFGLLASSRASIADLGPWADWLAHWLVLEREHESLRTLALTDELTGAGNRRAFERVAEDTISAARAGRRSVSLMYFDIDDFKSYNDRLGHHTGDRVLREVVELLRSVIRRGDHVFRVGGDEFVVLFADMRGAANPPLESVETIAHRFRERVCELRFPSLSCEGPATVSISAGVATFPWDGNDAGSLLHHADQLALQSKRSGKNRITFGPGAQSHCRDA
jgi:diguanylate cyclase (GGDEF)-like protein